MLPSFLALCGCRCDARDITVLDPGAKYYSYQLIFVISGLHAPTQCHSCQNTSQSTAAFLTIMNQEGDLCQVNKIAQKLKRCIRSWQDSNLRSHRESDFESDALTSRPQLLLTIMHFSQQVLKLSCAILPGTLICLNVRS